MELKDEASSSQWRGFKFFALSYGFRFSLLPWVILPDRLK